MDFHQLAKLAREGDHFLSTCSMANLAGQVFGGQLMAQALIAASDGLDDTRRLRSLSASFLRAVPLSPPASYRVQALMDGRSFNFREVQCSTAAGVAVQANLLFQQPEDGPEHQCAMPEVPEPQALPDLVELAEHHRRRLSEGTVRVLKERQLQELRPVDGESFLFCTDRQPAQRYWIRSCEALGAEARLHEAVFLYLSDAWLNSAMLIPHVDSRLARDFVAPTLTHQVWIHRELVADDWLLFDVRSDSLHGATGLVHANIFNRRGQLVASATQHSLFRHLPTRAQATGG